MTTTPAERARAWLAHSPLFLDTETTGLRSNAEICDLAVISSAGHVLINTLVKPTVSIPSDATQIHGITDADVANAPGFQAAQQLLAPLVKGRLIVIFNADYDLRLLKQSALAAGLPSSQLDFQAVCCMELYAEYFGDWNQRRGSFRWQKLEAASRQCGISWPTLSHRALADAQVTRLLLEHMARQAPAIAAAPLEQPPLP